MSQNPSPIDRLRGRGQVAGSYPVVIDRDWAAAMLRVTEEITSSNLLGIGSKATVKTTDRLKVEKQDLEARRGEAVIEFRFRHCSPLRYERMLSEHRPTDEQREEAKANGMGAAPRWSTGFRPAFVHEVLIEPILSREEVDELFGEGVEQSILTPGEAAELFTAALVASNNVARFEPTT